MVVQGTGKLTYDGQPIVLQPFQGEILRTLNVRPGDSVKKGQILATLDATSTKADLDALQTRQRQLRAHVNRLTAESSDLPYLADAIDGEAGKVQQEIFNRRMSEFRSRMKGYEETLGETQSSLKRARRATSRTWRNSWRSRGRSRGCRRTFSTSIQTQSSSF